MHGLSEEQMSEIVMNRLHHIPVEKQSDDCIAFMKMMSRDGFNADGMKMLAGTLMAALMNSISPDLKPDEFYEAYTGSLPQRLRRPSIGKPDINPSSMEVEY